MSAINPHMASAAAAPAGSEETTLKQVLITGGGTGIGAATAERLAAAGAAVTICGRTEATLRKAAQACKGAQVVQHVVLDVADEAGVVQLFQSRQFDAVVCAAGIIRTADVFELSTADFRSVMDVNLMGVYFVCREAMRQMRARGVRGDIVAISSIAGIRGMQVRFPGSFSYVASKHAVAGLVEAMAVDGRPYGIRVNCLSPGRVDTEIARQFGGIPEIKPAQIAALIETMLDNERSGVMSGSNVEVYSHD
ncbi:MAG TPA: SDR family NAD(P)-dependent oxidoreductase [Povalibacter sp.]